MPPRLRKLALTAHVTTSGGWLGAVAAFLALAVAGVRAAEPRTVAAVYPAMDLIGRWILVPLALASLVTGIVQALGTPWGLFRHYWVQIKLIVTAVATGVLILQLPAMRLLAAAALDGTLDDGSLDGTAADARISLIVHSGGGLLVLLVPMVLSVYKPRGLTAYGRRKVARAGAQPGGPTSGRGQRVANRAG